MVVASLHDTTCRSGKGVGLIQPSHPPIHCLGCPGVRVSKPSATAPDTVPLPHTIISIDPYWPKAYLAYTIQLPSSHTCQLSLFYVNCESVAMCIRATPCDTWDTQCTRRAPNAHDMSKTWIFKINREHWEIFWRLGVPPKLHDLIFQSMHGRLKGQAWLLEWTYSNKCPLCQVQIILHALNSCRFSELMHTTTD